jgi:hypothetical protein
MPWEKATDLLLLLFLLSFSLPSLTLEKVRVVFKENLGQFAIPIFFHNL